VLKVEKGALISQKFDRESLLLMKENQNILVVDDNRLTCWGLEKVISSQNLFVTTVTNGRDAISEICNTSYCSVFLDINLPDISGLEVLREIKRISPETKVIMMTADNTEDNKKKAMEIGAYHFMGKPFTIPEIKDILKNITGRDCIRRIM
jgi:DNA-binding NtrC family response regulator